MREQVRGHEAAVAVPADANALPVGDTHFHSLVDGCFGAGNELLDVGVVRRFARSDDRHRRVVQHRVSGQQQKQMRIAADEREAIGRAGDLSR